MFKLELFLFYQCQRHLSLSRLNDDKCKLNQKQQIIKRIISHSVGKIIISVCNFNKSKLNVLQFFKRKKNSKMKSMSSHCNIIFLSFVFPFDSIHLEIKKNRNQFCFGSQIIKMMKNLNESIASAIYVEKINKPCIFRNLSMSSHGDFRCD